MAASTEEKLKAAQAVRENLESKLVEAEKKEAELANKNLLDCVNAAVNAVADMDSGYPVTKEVKAATRKLYKKLVGSSAGAIASSESAGNKTTKNQKVELVDEFLKSVSGEFTLAKLATLAETKGVTVTGSVAQFFKSALEAKAKKVMVGGKPKKDGTSILWKNK